MKISKQYGAIYDFPKLNMCTTFSNVYFHLQNFDGIYSFESIAFYWALHTKLCRTIFSLNSLFTYVQTDSNEISNNFAYQVVILSYVRVKFPIKYCTITFENQNLVQLLIFNEKQAVITTQESRSRVLDAF